MRIGLDIMGGDNAPDATLEGAYLASKMLNSDERIVLVGDKNLAINWFSQKNIDSSLFDYIHAEQSVDMNEHATKALRKKPKNSNSIGFKLRFHKIS